MAVSAPTSPALLELRDLAREVAAEAGRLVLDHRPGALRFSTKSSDVDVVTEMDQAAQARILTALAQARPDDAVLGEEEGGRSGRTGITWVVDPIDGTTNYLYRLPFYAVSVAAVEGDPSVWGAWRPLAGAVVAPALGLAWGQPAGMARCAGPNTPLSVSRRPHVATCRGPWWEQASRMTPSGGLPRRAPCGR